MTHVLQLEPIAHLLFNRIDGYTGHVLVNFYVIIDNVVVTAQNMGNLASYMGILFRRYYQTTDDNNTIATNIRNLRFNNLTYVIEIDCGLLTTLRGMKVLNEQQIELIESKQTRSNKICQLIDDVIAMTHEQQQQFLNALNETQQSHVVVYIRANGIRSESGDDNWPLRFTECDEAIEKNWIKLVEILDSRNGLLDELLSVGCINWQHKQWIETGKTDAQVNELLLRILQRRSVADYNKFIDSLMKTKSHAVASLLEPNIAGNKPAQHDEQNKKLLTKHALLIALIDTRNGLLAELMAEECITWRQKKFIEAAATEAESNARLLEIIKRGMKSDFDIFVECLERTGQHHVKRILMGEGVAVHMVAKLCRNENSTGDETCIVEQFMSLLYSSSDEKVEQLRVKMIQLCDERLGRDVRLAALDTQGSIRLFYLCNSLAGVHYLYELYSSAVLKTHTEELFTLLLDNSRPVNLASLDWNIADYTNGVRIMCASTNLSLFDEIYRMADEIHCKTTQEQATVLGFDRLPSEIVEMLLIKAAGQLFVTIQKMTPKAEAYIVATVSAVSFIWWRTLTYRKFNKRLLKSYCRETYLPYKCILHQLSHIKSDRNVVGVAEVNNKLYVAGAGSNKIQVFASRPSFSRLEDIKVEGLNDPNDIIACSETSQLYVADWQPCVIWRVNLLSDKQVDKFTTTQWPPCSLSIKSRRLLITPDHGNALFIYGDDGIQLNRIPLPDYMLARHAVESSRNTYIVSHYKRLINDMQFEHKDGVSEFDVDGRIIRQFNNQIDTSLQFKWPHYLLIDASNHVIVADYRNERIVLLKPDLQLKRVLLPKLLGQPTRMCFNEETGLLFVSCLRSTEIRIFGAFQRHSLAN